MSEAAAHSGLRPGTGIVRLLSDDRLAQRAAKGDERAFAAIFRRYQQGLYRFCLAIVGDSQDAQDALQNTMVKVLRALPGEERQIQLKPWLYRIAHNESIELLRRRRDTRQLDSELASPGSGLAEETASRERLRMLIRDLDELPERQRGALVMRELGGLGFAEIGAALGTSPAAARQTLYEARLSLRQMDEGREMSCETVTRALSDGDGRVARRRDVRAHLRTCAGCRRFREEIGGRERDFAALSPLPAAAAAGLLQGLLGGHAGGGGLAGTLGGGAAKSLGASAALKGAATVTIVAAIGVGAADRGGLIDVGLPGDGGSQANRAERPVGAGSTRARPTRASSAAVGAAARPVAGAAKGIGELRASQAAKPGAAKVAIPAGGKTSVDAAPSPGPTSETDSPSQSGSVSHPGGKGHEKQPQDSPVSHPHGKGHEKQLPSASAHGQETAASHKTAKHGSAGTESPAAHPSKPSHPAHPANPSAEKGPSSPPSSAVGPEAHSHGKAATQAAGSEEAPPEHETGKKP